MNKKEFPWEAVIWIGGLVVVSIPDPTVVRAWSLCIFEMAGITFCPGCGLGRAVAFLVRGELSQSLNSHVLAIPAVVGLLWRASYLFWIFLARPKNY